MTLIKLVTFLTSTKFGFKIFLGVFSILLVTGCIEEETIDTDKQPKVIKKTNKIEQSNKSDVIPLSLEQIYYGAKYCLSVTEQMRQDMPKKKCEKLKELLNKAETYSKLSLDSIDASEAYEYFKIAETNLYEAVDLMDKCGSEKFDMPILI